MCEWSLCSVFLFPRRAEGCESNYRCSWNRAAECRLKIPSDFCVLGCLLWFNRHGCGEWHQWWACVVGLRNKPDALCSALQLEIDYIWPQTKNGNCVLLLLTVSFVQADTCSTINIYCPNPPPRKISAWKPWVYLFWLLYAPSVANNFSLHHDIFRLKWSVLTVKSTHGQGTKKNNVGIWLICQIIPRSSPSSPEVFEIPKHRHHKQPLISTWVKSP